MKKFFPAMSVLLGIYWVIGGFTQGVWIRKGPGGGFLPVIAGGLTIIFGTIVLIVNDKDKSPSGFSWKAFTPVIAIIALLMFSYVLGLIISIAIYIFLWLKYVEKQDIFKSLLTGVSTSVIVYLIFGLWLRVPLPSGILELL